MFANTNFHGVVTSKNYFSVRPLYTFKTNMTKNLARHFEKELTAMDCANELARENNIIYVVENLEGEVLHYVHPVRSHRT